MLNNKTIEIIKDIGLTENEAKIYLANLSIGPATAINIAKEAGIIRTTAYSVIEALKIKGLINVEINGLKKLFVASNPENLIKTYELKKDNLKKIIPELSSKYQIHTGLNFIKYYEGVAGFKKVYNDMLKELRYGDKYLIISDIKKFMDIDKDFFEGWVERRSHLHLSLRTLLQRNPEAEKYKEYGKRINWDIRYLPKDVDLISNLVILKNKVVITQMVSPILTIVIENPGIIQLQEEQFEIIWQSAKDN